MLTNGSHPYRRESNEGDLVVCKKRSKEAYTKNPETETKKKTVCVFAANKSGANTVGRR